MVVVAEQEGQVEREDLRNEVAERPCGCDDDIQGTDLQALDHVSFAAQLARRRLGAGKRSIGYLFKRCDECLGANAIVRIRRQGMPDNHGLLCPGGCRGAEQGNCSGQGDQSMFHKFLPKSGFM